MSGGFKVLLLIILLTFVCICGYVVSMTVFSAGVLAVAPPPFKKGITEWMLGTPQPITNAYVWAGDDYAGYGDIVVSTLAFDGYIGPVGFLCTPLMPDIPYSVTDYYGSPRGNFVHPGIDFGSHYGEGHNVITPMSGKVVATRIYSAWGYTLAIENNGYQVLLTHASEILVNEGDYVNAGDVVMLSGGDPNGPNPQYAGSTTGPHLHFEVRKCGIDEETGDSSCVAVDPSATLLPGQSSLCMWENLTESKTRP